MGQFSASNHWKAIDHYDDCKDNVNQQFLTEPAPSELDKVPPSERAASARVLCASAEAERMRGNLAAAQKLAESGRYLAELPSGEPALASILFIMSMVKYDIADFPRAAELALLGLDRVDRTLEPMVFVRLNAIAAFSFAMLHAFMDADYYARRGLEFARAHDDLGNIARALNGVSAVSEQCGNYAESIRACEEGITLAVVSNLKDLEGGLRHNLVLAMTQISKTKLASHSPDSSDYAEDTLRVARDAVQFADKNKFGSLFVATKILLARQLFAVGNHDEALREARHARGLANEQGIAARNGDGWLVEGRVLEARGEYEAAERCFVEALNFAREVSNYKGTVEAWSTMIEHFKKRGMTARAMDCSESLISEYEAQGRDIQKNVQEAMRILRDVRPAA